MAERRVYFNLEPSVSVAPMREQEQEQPAESGTGLVGWVQSYLNRPFDARTFAKFVTLEILITLVLLDLTLRMGLW